MIFPYSSILIGEKFLFSEILFEGMSLSVKGRRIARDVFVFS